MTFSPDASPGSISPGKPLEPTATGPQPAKDFQSYMQPSSQSQAGLKAQPSSGPSPINMAQGSAIQAGNPSMESILNQTRSMQDSIGVVGNQLKTQDLKLKRSQAHLLKNKLTDAQGYIRQAAQKTGIEPQPFHVPAGANAIGRFVAYVNDGQNQLIQVEQRLKKMSSKGQQLNAAEMLSITVKMNLAQQEIEYSATLLGKVVDSIKQLMNTQL